LRKRGCQARKSQNAAVEEGKRIRVKSPICLPTNCYSICPQERSA
jgi:hypothetical protein